MSDRDKKTIFVASILYSASYVDVYNFCRQCGPIANLDLIKDRNGNFKGYAFCEYETMQDAQRALGTLHNTLLCGRYVKVNLRSEPRFAHNAARASVSTLQNIQDKACWHPPTALPHVPSTFALTRPPMRMLHNTNINTVNHNSNNDENNSNNFQPSLCLPTQQNQQSKIQTQQNQQSKMQVHSHPVAVVSAGFATTTPPIDIAVADFSSPASNGLDLGLSLSSVSTASLGTQGIIQHPNPDHAPALGLAINQTRERLALGESMQMRTETESDSRIQLLAGLLAKDEKDDLFQELRSLFALHSSYSHQLLLIHPHLAWFILHALDSPS